MELSPRIGLHFGLYLFPMEIERCWEVLFRSRWELHFPACAEFIPEVGWPAGSTCVPVTVGCHVSLPFKDLLLVFILVSVVPGPLCWCESRRYRQVVVKGSLDIQVLFLTWALLGRITEGKGCGS